MGEERKREREEVRDAGRRKEQQQKEEWVNRRTRNESASKVTENVKQC